MALHHYEPWSLLNQLSSELTRLHDQRAEGDDSLATADWVPPVDIREEEDRYLLYADLPGVEPKDIDISMENGVLEVSTPKQEKLQPRRTEVQS